MEQACPIQTHLSIPPVREEIPAGIDSIAFSIPLAEISALTLLSLWYT